MHPSTKASADTDVVSDEKVFAVVDHIKDAGVELSPVERAKLLRKIDWHLLPLVSILYLLSFMDRSNIGNAKIAGMSKDLHLVGLRYNIAAAVFFVPYSFAEVPSNIILKLIRPSRWIPAIMIVWGLVMTLMCLVNTYHGLIAARVFLGLAESGLFPGVNYYISLWYPRADRAMRIAIFFSAASVAGAFGGILAYGIEHMEGVGGLHGWQWIFCLEGLTTIVMAVVAFIFMPDYPATASFLTEAERRNITELLKHDSQGLATHYDFRFVLQALKDYKTFVQIGIYIGVLVPIYAISLFTPTIINELGFSAANAQLLSIPPFVAAGVSTIAVGIYSDIHKFRGPYVIGGAFVSLVGYIVLYTQSGAGASYAGTVLASVGAFPTIAVDLAWAGSNAGGEMKRAVALAMVIGLGNLGGICSSFIYIDPPRFHIGHGTIMGFLSLTILLSTFAMWDYNRYNKKKEELCREQGITEDRTAEFQNMGDENCAQTEPNSDRVENACPSSFKVDISATVDALRLGGRVSAIVGNFSGARTQEIIVAHGTRLELLLPDVQTGKLSTVVTSDVFGSVRSLAAFRLTGSTKDYAIVGSDSGRIVILDYDPKTSSFVKLHQETFGKSGARRIVPGQYLAIDPKGRSVMISAIEKTKFVYILNRDAAANLTISSPLEAHKNNAIIHHIVGLDVGFENPLFAALEVDYTESDQDPTGEAFNNAEKMLTYYELDLGLNHVVRKWSEPTDPRANLLVQVPGGQVASTDRFDGPSGVLVCCEDHIIYRHMDKPQHRVPIPRRRHPLEDPSRGVIIIAAVMHKMKGAFFFLLQSEDGDLFKVTIDHEEDEVRALKIKYFDTVPVASSLCILKSGFLFVASEFGNHCLYQFQKLGDDDNEPEFTSTSYPAFGMADPTAPLPHAHFRPRPLDNLALADEVESLDPILDSKVMNILPNSDTPQILAACGRGARSSFRMLRHGLDVEESVSSELPGIPNAVWTTKQREEDEFDSYIILSFVNGTLVLSIGETIEEVQDTGFLSSAPTLAVQQIGADALLQVHPHGIRHVLAGRRVNEWRVPDRKTIVAATTNKRQVVVALSSAELVYFELDLDGQLNEYQDRKAMGSTVLALSIAEVPEGRQRTPFLAVGCEDQTVRVISLDPESTLETLSLQALTAPPSAICIADMLDASINKTQPTMFVNIGLQNGVLLRTVLDPLNGQLTDTRTRFLGTRPIKLIRVRIQSSPAILALSSRSWINYTHQNLMHFTPLIFENLDYAWSFSAELSPEGLIGITGSVLRIFQIPKLGMKLKQDSIPLSYTPRKFISHPTNRYLYLIEGDHRVMGEEAINKRLQELSEVGKTIDREMLELPAETFGRCKAPAGTWASAIRIIDPVESKTVALIHLDNNEAAFSLAVVSFAARGGELHLVVGTASDTFLAPRSCSSGFLRTYRFVEDGAGLELVHKTETDDVPLAVMAFQGRLLAGVGKALRVYEIGKKKLLRKAENKTFSSAIVTLNTQGSRILVGDMQDSIFFAVYKAPENRLLIFADDMQPRWIVSSTMVDYCTVAASDRFGNIFVNRLDNKISDQVDDDPTGAGILHEKGQFMGAPHKTKMICHFHVGDLVTSIHRVSLVAGGREVLLYTGLHGTIGILVPFVSKEDVDFISTLEQHMRTEQGSIVGRDHLAWRGYYVPVKAVVDGDLCETYARLPGSKQSAIAGELDRTVGEVLKKLEQLRITASGF